MHFGAGLYATMSAAVYFEDPCPQPSLSQSIAKILLAQSPAHARLAHPRLNPNWKPDENDYDKAKAIGNAAHALILGRGKNIVPVQIPAREKKGRNWVTIEPVTLVDAEDFKTDAAQEERDRIAEAGDVPILRKHLDVAAAIHAAAREQIDLAGCPEAFTEGNAEVVMIAYDEEYGIYLRSMVDWMYDTCLLYDLKTGMTSAAPQAIPMRILNQGWDIQAAMQERILDILDPDNRGRRRFRFIAIEDDEPYALTVNEMTEAIMEFGRRKLRMALAIWRDCLKRNVWPAYPAMVLRPEMPGWAENAWLDRESRDAERAPLVPEVLYAG